MVTIMVIIIIILIITILIIIKIIIIILMMPTLDTEYLPSFQHREPGALSEENLPKLERTSSRTV